MDGERTEHESFGLINFNRVSWGGAGTTLFGSSIRHGHIIRLRISRAALYRDLHRDWYSDQRQLIEVDLSLTQFVEAITTMNTMGVPCTIRYVGGEEMAKPPYVNKREQFQDEFAADCKEVANRIKDVEKLARDIADAKAPSKADRQALLALISGLHTHLASNMPFVVSQFNEQMDKTVVEAKGEVEAFVQHKIISAGLESILEQGKPLVAIEDQSEETE